MKSQYEEMVHDLEILRSSTDYCLYLGKEPGHLIVEGIADTGNSDRRMQFVRMAIETSEVKQVILNKAYSLCRGSLLSSLQERGEEDLIVSEIIKKIKEGII